MAELDYGNIYNTNGEVIQIRYAQKHADGGSLVLALKNSRCAVLIAAKPKVSNLHIYQTDYRIKKITSNAYLACSGLLTDGQVIHGFVRNEVANYVSNFGTKVSAEYLKSSIASNLYMFTSYMSLRPIGANFLTIINDNGKFQIILGEPNGGASLWKAYAIGNGARRAFTELEKLNLESLDVETLIDEGIKILYKCHDSLNDLPFDIEVGYISSDCEFARPEQNYIAEIVEKYKNLSIDED